MQYFQNISFLFWRNKNYDSKMHMDVQVIQKSKKKKILK